MPVIDVAQEWQFEAAQFQSQKTQSYHWSTQSSDLRNSIYFFQVDNFLSFQYFENEWDWTISLRKDVNWKLTF